MNVTVKGVESSSSGDRSPVPKYLSAGKDLTSRAWRLGALAAILILYVAMAVGYSLAVPIFEAPDEPAHFLFANDLAASKGLPVLDYSESPKEYHQPPLYYWLVAIVLRWFDTSGYEQFTVRNPHAAISDASTFGNKNAYLHDPRREAWPFKEFSLAVHMGRLVSIGLGMVTVGATYGLALKLFSPSTENGERYIGAAQLGMALAAASVVAFNPQFLFISGVLNNDNAVTAIAGLALLAAVAYYDRSRSLRWLIGLGVLSGLAILTKTTGFAVVALMLGVLAAKAIRQHQIGIFWLDAGIVILLAALIGGWWYIRNAVLYTDPLLSGYIHRWLSDEAAPRRATEVLDRFEQGEISFWGTFGWLNITLDEWIYKLLRIWTRLSGLGLLILGVSWLTERLHPGRGPQTRMAMPVLVITLAWTGLVAALLVQWILVSGGLQGRLLFPAISALAVLLIAGWTSLVPRRWQLVAGTIPMVGLALLAIVTPFVTISPAYARPKVLTSTVLPEEAISTDLTYVDRVKLIGYQVSPSIAHPGDQVDVTLYWQVLEPIPDDFSIFVHLFGRHRQRIGSIDTYPSLGNFPTSQWESGYVIRDVYPIRIDPDAATPTLVEVSVGFYDYRGSREGIHALDSSGHPTTTAGVFKLVPHTWPEKQPAHELGANFGNIVTLLGYDAQFGTNTLAHLENGEETLKSNNLTIALFWRSDSPPTTDLTVFVHLIDNNGNIISQMDQPPLNGDYPTSAWEAGEVIQDNLTIPIRSVASLKGEVPSGELWLRFGLYQSDTGVRLPVFDENGDMVDDAVTSADPVILP